MCGFIYSSLPVADLSQFEKFSSCITHRGPDDYELVNDERGV